ncbi:MAG: acetylxylan esterase [Bryobacter sp.]|nr:acetylxylan esterase [Bryobacter sp. CoA8 C33]
MMRWLLILSLAGTIEGQDPYTDYIDRIGQGYLKQRREAVRGIRTEAEAKERARASRAKVLRQIGGLPDYRGPLRAKTVKTLDRGAYWLELVHFESLPGYVVTGNLYRPKQSGRHPAVLYSIGHWDEGKIAGQRIGANLAAKGFVVLAYDPVGQGERQQAFDERHGRSLIGGSTEQHFVNGAQALLAGESVARYFIHDSMRAIDYLLSRPEVDGSRIGASGCSGGGTQTMYVAALDERIKVAAPSCVMNSFEKVMAGPTGDSEQSFPGFVSEGLDQADWIYQFAPKPWLISSTEEDFFTPAGAEIVYRQGVEFYRVFGAEEKLKWVVGPGGHGTPLKVREAIYEWMIRWLKGGAGDAKEMELEMLTVGDLCVFAGCRAPGKELTEVIAEGWKGRRKKGDIRKRIELGGPGSGLSEVKWLGPETQKEELLVMVNDGVPAERRAASLAKLGLRVKLVKLPGSGQVGGRYSGGWIDHTRAWLVGKNLPSIRANDLLVETRQELDRYQKVYLHGWAWGGIPALYAAQAEKRIAGVWIERTPWSLAMAMEARLPRNLHEAIVVGLALEGDFADLMDKRFFIVDAHDWNENRIERAIEGVYRRPFEQTDEELLAAFRKHVLHRELALR